MTGRPERLRYLGNGVLFAYGVPARDLDAADIAELSDEQLAHITGAAPDTGKPLYEAFAEKAPLAPAKAVAGKESKQHGAE